MHLIKYVPYMSSRDNRLIFDPPYSPRQIAECYKAAGLKVDMVDTQNARMYAACRGLFEQIAAPGCVVLSFGWNSTGMGKAWERLEQLNVCHGGAHNDTICVADRLPPQLFDSPANHALA